MKVLIAEDDVDLLDLTIYALRREGYWVSAASDGQQALQCWRSDRPDIVLLDVCLPKIHGFEVCRRIREESATPIIMLTARREHEDVVQGLDLGADDYVTKPFHAKELTARMRAVLRRSQAGSVAPVKSQIQVGDLAINLQSHEATKAGAVVQLTRLEFRILHLLAVNAGRVVPYADLIRQTWGYENGDALLLKSHVFHIRKKLGFTSGRRGEIRNVASVGYILDLPDDAARPDAQSRVG